MAKEIGEAALKYFQSMVAGLERSGFADDDLLREGFQEAVLKKEVVLRVLDKLVEGGSYNEAVLNDGALEINVCSFPSSIKFSFTDYEFFHNADFGEILGLVDVGPNQEHY